MDIVYDSLLQRCKCKDDERKPSLDGYVAWCDNCKLIICWLMSIPRDPVVLLKNVT